MGNAVPGGVRDDAGDTAFLRLASQELVAVALADGRVRWRRANAGRPVAASTVHVLTACDFNYELLSAATGALVTTLPFADLPEPADIIDATLVEAPGGVHVRWTCLDRYRSGASPTIPLALPLPQTGTLTINLATGGTDVPGAAPPPNFGPAPSLQLKTKGKTLVLEARDGAGVPCWSTDLGAFVKSNPAPLAQ
jgi:hypothetical protein